ncbi:MAG: ABC transporter permease subunit [Nitrospirae bacterium]|nr:ABC transporter permease subunit [Nitrospirota bacterium]
MVFTDAMKAIARKELSDKLKSRWVLVIAAGFAVFTLVISYFGGATSGVAGFRSMDATIASLTSLVTYFIPILALTLGGGIIADERDKGTLEIYLAAPVSVAELISGKFIGLAIALTLSTLVGLGVSGIVLLAEIGMNALSSYLIFMLNSVILGIIFLSISFVVSILFTERARVIAFTVFLWLFFAILYDLGLIGLLIITKGAVGEEIFSGLLMLNPVDVYRILNFLSIGELKVFLGLAAVELPAYMKMPVLWAISLLWVVLPLIMSYHFFKRRYLA